MTELIGRRIRGVVDRPAGSRHPRNPDILYPINYGYVPGVFAGDGSEQDVYVLGTDQPLRTFGGTVIAVFHRTDDVEDKWIVSTDGRDYTDGEILAAIHFVEQYFHGVLLRSYPAPELPPEQA